MGLHDLLENHGQNDQQTREEGARQNLSHSFSPFLSTAEPRSGLGVPNPRSP
jgi:hypothetical protein